MSMAATMKPKGSGIQGGWLSMAPQVDEVQAVPPSSEVASSSVASWNFIGNHFASNSSSHIEPAPRIGNRQRPRVGSTAASRLLPRTNARFKVGDSSAVGTPIPPDTPYSRGSDCDSPPIFDVRASYAPMPKWGTSTVNGNVEAKSKASIDTTSSDEAADMKAELEFISKGDAEDSHSEVSDDGLGIRHGGRRWKGKTAHAVELEMEALGDVTVMSYAPDAVYLASRLEGLRRNLEVGGERFKRRVWEDYDEDEKEAKEGITVHDSDSFMAIDKGESHVERGSHPTTTDLKEGHFDSLVSSLGGSQSHTPNEEAAAASSVDADISGSEDVSIASSPMPTIHPADEIAANKMAKAAALDSRVEVRTLRRPDLEQVRELHCYHGNSDKVEAETYTTSAGFLLRLLVDEHHVCLVAVAKPLPEPPSLPTKFAPNAPPPSLDMPPSKSPFLLAGHTRTATPRRYTPLSHSKLAPLAHDKGLVDAPAPRSFGIGGGGSSDMEMGEDAETHLSDGAKKSSALQTGFTSPQKSDKVTQIEDYIETKRQIPASPPLQTPPPSHVDSVLAGPTHDVAPPRAIKIMGAPPINGVRTDLENILGVASARIKVVRRTEGDDAFGKSEALDSSWPGLDPKGQKSMVTREAHIISLSVQPGERGQGLGSRLLDHLLDECKRRTAGPRVSVHLGDSLAAQTAPRIHENAPMRTFLEVHPTNEHAINLYKSRGFHQVPGSKGVVKHYFRGDGRIPNAVRVKIGGSDAMRMERFDFK